MLYPRKGCSATCTPSWRKRSLPHERCVDRRARWTATRAGTVHEWVLELRAVDGDDLHPGGRSDVVPRRLLQRGRSGDRAWLAAVLSIRTDRGGDDGAGGVGISAT